MDETLNTPLLDEAAMTDLAAAMSPMVSAPLIVFLEGDLGAGKTTFVRAFIRSLGYTGRVKSPTYGLLEIYPLEQFDVIHLDLYRIAESGELEFLGLDDLHGPDSVFMVEWPDRGVAHLPQPDLTICFKHSGDGRFLHFQPHNDRSRSLVTSLAGYLQ
jgi:tRNA threonylcarbamoyladenosine biosynthesis protein TsaE